MGVKTSSPTQIAEFRESTRGAVLYENYSEKIDETRCQTPLRDYVVLVLVYVLSKIESSVCLLICIFKYFEAE